MSTIGLQLVVGVDGTYLQNLFVVADDFKELHNLSLWLLTVGIPVV